MIVFVLFIVISNYKIDLNTTKSFFKNNYKNREQISYVKLIYRISIWIKKLF